MTEILEKKMFEDLSLEAKKAYYRAKFELVDGVFQKTFIGREKVEVNLKLYSLKFRKLLHLILSEKGYVGLNDSLENLHECIPKEMKVYDFQSGVNKISEIFYHSDSRLESLYIDFMRFLQKEVMNFPFYFQKIPTIRVQCPEEETSNLYPRYHTDIAYGHPPQEINMWIPLTRPSSEEKHGFKIMGLKDTRKLLSKYGYNFATFIEDSTLNQGIKDLQASMSVDVETKLGDALIFDSRLLHSGIPMHSQTRISIDIRIIPVEDYQNERYAFKGSGRRKIIFDPENNYHNKKSYEI